MVETEIVSVVETEIVSVLLFFSVVQIESLRLEMWPRERGP